MFIYRYNKIWLCIDLQNRIFYITVPPDSKTVSFDNIIIVPGDFEEPQSEEENIQSISKKFNFLEFGGYKKTEKLGGSQIKKIFGIIDFKNKVQYGKNKNKFITLFRPLSYSIGNTDVAYLIKTKNRLNHNVYAFAACPSFSNDTLNQFILLDCLDILGPIHQKSVDLISPFHAMECYPNRIKTQLENHLTERLDLTDKNVFSIDGDSTLDVDDAIHYESTGEKQIIGIHIADVVNMFSHIRDIEKHQFVTQLMENVSSIYPGSGKVDMINKDAGENLCSLNEGEPRNVVSLLLEFEPIKPHKLLSAKIHLSKIINRHKMTYKEMDKIIETKRRHVLQQDILQIRDIIDANDNLPATMEMDEYKEEGENQSRAIIAKLMATYNTIMAKKLFDGNKNSILRVHYGATIPERGSTGNKEIDKLLERMATFKGYYVVSRQTNEAEIEHRGLGLKYYTHMTSPIRRFVDFWNQLCMYEILGKLEGETAKYKIEERISFLNWKQMQIKKSYEMLDMVNLFHRKMEDELEAQYTGFILGWGENNQISVFIPDINKKVLKFSINQERLENILEKKEDETKIIWKRKDNDNIFIFEKYMKILCRIVLQKNRYEWQNKVGIEVIEPNFSDFLMS
jgi:hypothetical protein